MELEDAAILKSLGLNQSNKWVLYDEQGYKFFKWLGKKLKLFFSDLKLIFNFSGQLRQLKHSS